MIYDYFRVTGAHDTVLDSADLFSVTRHDDHIQEIENVEDEVDGQEERQDERRENRQQGEESGEVEENQTHNMSARR